MKDANNREFLKVAVFRVLSKRVSANLREHILIKQFCGTGGSPIRGGEALETISAARVGTERAYASDF